MPVADAWLLFGNCCYLQGWIGARDVLGAQFVVFGVL